jgi:hypothetical protein
MGFPQLAQLVVQDPDHETYLFRSFDQLTTRTLLQLQSELAHLEKEQQRLDEEGEKLGSNRSVQMMLTRWQSLDDLDDETQKDPDVRRRIELADRIAGKFER